MSEQKLSLIQLNQQLADSHRQLDSAHKEKDVLDVANRALLGELEQSQQAVSDLIKQREALTQKHVQDAADLKLRHEQEIFILKKMKR